MKPAKAMDVEAALDLRVDPVAEADEYRQMLLGVLGDRDPANAQAEFPDRLSAAIEGVDRTLLRTKPKPNEWSALEILGHILDAEIVLAGRYRWILAHDEPPLVGYDQDRWIERLHHPHEDPQEMLALFRALRQANLGLWQRTSGADRARVGIHSERGSESYELSFRLLAGHDLFHLGQLRRTLDQVTGRPG
jgi:hypothetical protein